MARFLQSFTRASKPRPPHSKPSTNEGIVLNIELINPVQEDEKDGDVDVRVRIKPNNVDEEFEVEDDKGVSKLIPEGKLANHLFRGVGKLANNPANRTLIQNIANGKPLGTDAYGKSWCMGVDGAGKSVYTYAQNGVVKGAGYATMTPAEMIAKYGLK